MFALIDLMTHISWRLVEAGHCRHPEIMTRRGGRWSACEFPALVAILDHPSRGKMLFDTGYSQHFLDATDHFPEALYRWLVPVSFSATNSVAAQLNSQKLPTSAVNHVILSHFHGDHIGGLRDFRSARIHCSAAGLTDLMSRSRVNGLRIGLLSQLIPEDIHARAGFFEDSRKVELTTDLRPFEHGYDLFGDNSIIGIALPGHAPGHFGITFLTKDAQRVFLVADAAWSSAAIEQNTAPPALVSGWLGDTDTYRATLSMLHELHCRSPQVWMVPAHCQRWRSKVGAQC